MNDKSEILQEIETENFIWIIYLFIIGISFVANHFENNYYKTGNKSSKEKYRLLNIFVFSVALLVYIYFFRENYEKIQKHSCYDSKSKIHFNNLNFIASVLIVIAGAILLYIAIFDKELETEISFN